MRRLLLVFLGALALAAPAQAQDPQVDPGSPAGTEYQLPIDRAREQAGEGSGGSGGSQRAGTSGEAPLFGVGVEENKSNTLSTNSGPDGDPATTADVEPDLGTRAPDAASARAPATDNGGSGLVAIAGGALGVLLLGGLAGLAWRRRTVRR